MSRPVLQVTLDEQMYLEILKLKADFTTASTWNTSPEWKDRLIRFAQNVVVKSHVFASVEILSPFEDDIVFPKPNLKKQVEEDESGSTEHPGEAPAVYPWAKSWGTESENSPGESIKDYI